MSRLLVRRIEPGARAGVDRVGFPIGSLGRASPLAMPLEP
jgi:hypothetical protein